MTPSIKLGLAALALAAFSLVSGCGKSLDASYCPVEGGRLTFKDGKITSDDGKDAGTYEEKDGIVTIKLQLSAGSSAMTFQMQREENGGLSGPQFQLPRCS
jgi:hypothetical protein